MAQVGKSLWVGLAWGLWGLFPGPGVKGSNKQSIEVFALPAAYRGDPEARERLAESLKGALNATAAFGALPAGPWEVWLHSGDEGFEQATGAPPQRAAAWVGATLHLRPWARLARRDLGALLRHELTHRRLGGAHLPRWQEEARCLWAEGHTRPQAPWPPDPEPQVQARLDLALRAGTTATQAWAYHWLRAWLNGAPPPPGPDQAEPGSEDPWEREGGAGTPPAPSMQPGPGPARAQPAETVWVTWPPDRLPRTLVVEGESLPWRACLTRAWQGAVHIGPGAPMSLLEGEVQLRAADSGWALTWVLPAETWIAAATAGELGEDAPWEAKRALAAVLALWLEAHPQGNHPGGGFCPLTHCAVVRGQPSAATLAAASRRPGLDLDPQWAFYSSSKGGVALSPREVWGRGPDRAPAAPRVPGDPWADWERTFSAAQVRELKAAVRPGLAEGQLGLRLGPSGPYAVERLRLEAGRRFCWSAWPSNACAGELDGRGALHLTGHGLGHNTGLCLATAVFRARQGASAEQILAEAFPGAGSTPAR